MICYLQDIKNVLFTGDLYVTVNVQDCANGDGHFDDSRSFLTVTISDNVILLTLKQAG